MTKEERARRVVIVCSKFGKNMAHYRAAWLPEHKVLLTTRYWANVNGNCLDLCVLEWCKLFGDRRGAHSWGNILANPEEFETSLLDNLGVTPGEFEREIRTMRSYRDKFVAHLDSEKTMNIPTLNMAYRSVALYHRTVISTLSRNHLQGLQLDFERGYQKEVAEASRVYASAIKSMKKTSQF